MRHRIAPDVRASSFGENHPNLRFVGLGLFTFSVFAAIFYFEAYFSVSSALPGSIPIHHDDYSNYSQGFDVFEWSWSRPFSSYTVHILALAGPDWLIGAVRFLTIQFVLLSWVLLYQVVRPRPSWLMFLTFGAAVFSTPVIVEYARYTGMITHLLSGCLGLAAVASLFRAAATYEEGRCGHTWLLVSVSLLVLSSTAKEDFVGFYMLSLVYACLRWPTRRSHLIIVASIGVMISLALIAASRYLAASSFVREIGVVNSTSSYYINLAPSSVVHTAWRYLLSQSHPAMHPHGEVVAAIFGTTVLIAIGLTLVQRKLSRSSYFVLAALTLIGPYSVLPNHVNAYYEFIWLPMLIAAAVAATTEVFMLLPNSSALRLARPALILPVLALTLSAVDYVGRASVAEWYDGRERSNARTLAILDDYRTRINAAKTVCVTGADDFSPWYMHDTHYLRNRIGIDATWYLLNDPVSPYHSGLLAGAAASMGGTIVVDDPAEFPPNCLRLSLGEDL